MSDLLDGYRLDRRVVTIASLSERSDECEYWHALTPHERLQALEFLRQVCYGYDPAATRLQRVLTVVKLAEG